MINTDVMQELIRLAKLYEKNWNHALDFTGMPSTLSEERLCLVLRRIVDTGESIIVGFQKVSDSDREYSKYTVENTNAIDGLILERPCPFCNGKVVMNVNGNSYEYKCETDYCYRIICRGI